MTVTVHAGLPNAQADTLHQLFSSLTNLTYLGRGVTEELDRANEAMGRPAGWEAPKIKPVFDAAIAAGAGPALLSRPSLTSWRASSPRFTGSQLAELFEKPKLIFITRRTVQWAWDYYFSRLALLRPDTLAGLNPWVEKHMSQLRIGSELAQVQFIKTISYMKEKSGAEEILVLPCEMLERDPALFLGRIDAFIGLDGALAAKAEGLELQPDNAVSMEYADTIRALRLARRQRDEFLEVMGVVAAHTRKPMQAQFQALKDEPSTSSENWISWFRNGRFQIRRAVAAAKPELLAVIPRNDDYEMRVGLAGYLQEIEDEETDALEDAFGIDLRAYGYAPEPAPAA